MIKVCHLLDNLEVGGLEKTVKYIALNLGREKYSQQVWCLRDKAVLAGEIEQAGILVRPFYFRGGIFRNFQFLQLARALAQENFMIIHAHGLYPSIWARLAAIFTRIPVRVVHCQNLYYGLGIKDRLLLKSLSNFTTSIIAVSEAVRFSLTEAVGINPRKIQVIYNSSPEIARTSLIEGQNIRKELGINDNDFVIGAAGRLNEQKGYRYLIEAISFLKPATPNLKCLIIGKGDQREALESEAANLGLRNQIIFTGQRMDIEKLYPLIDIFVQPSTLREGLPLVLAEAASCGIALIATNVGGNPEIVLEGFNGFVIPPQDALQIAGKIKYLLANPALRKTIAENAKKTWQEKFSLEKMMKKIELLYQNSLAQL